MKRTSYIFNLNREVSLIDLDWILIDECAKGNWEASIDMAEGDHLWLSATDENGEKWRVLGKETTFDRAYVVIEYEEWDDPRRFIENIKANLQERIEEPVVKEEIEILETVNSINDEIEAIEYSNEIIEIEEEIEEIKVETSEEEEERIDYILDICTKEYFNSVFRYLDKIDEIENKEEKTEIDIKNLNMFNKAVVYLTKDYRRYVKKLTAGSNNERNQRI